MWQDTVIALCQTGFILALLPTVLGEEKPAISTSILNTFLVGIIALTFVTLELWLAVASSTVTGLLWLVLAVQQYRRHQAAKAATKS